MIKQLIRDLQFMNYFLQKIPLTHVANKEARYDIFDIPLYIIKAVLKMSLQNLWDTKANAEIQSLYKKKRLWYFPTKIEEDSQIPYFK